MQKKKLLAQDIEKLENTSLAALVAYVEGEVSDSTGTQAQCCTSTRGAVCVCCITVDAVAIRYAAFDGGLVA